MNKRTKHVKATVTLEGEAFDLISNLRHLRVHGERTICLKIQVNYPGSFFPDWYSLPPITANGASPAKKALESLLQQGVVDTEQFDYYARAIQETESAI